MTNQVSAVIALATVVKKKIEKLLMKVSFFFSYFVIMHCAIFGVNIKSTTMIVFHFLNCFIEDILQDKRNNFRIRVHRI